MRALIALCTQLTRDYYYLVVIIDAEYKAQIPIFAISPNPPYREGGVMIMRYGTAQYSTPPLSNPNKNYTTL